MSDSEDATGFTYSSTSRNTSETSVNLEEGCCEHCELVDRPLSPGNNGSSIRLLENMDGILTTLCFVAPGGYTNKTKSVEWAVGRTSKAEQAVAVPSSLEETKRERRQATWNFKLTRTKIITPNLVAKKEDARKQTRNEIEQRQKVLVSLRCQLNHCIERLTGEDLSQAEEDCIMDQLKETARIIKTHENRVTDLQTKIQIFPVPKVITKRVYTVSVTETTVFEDQEFELYPEHWSHPCLFFAGRGMKGKKRLGLKLFFYDTQNQLPWKELPLALPQCSFLHATEARNCILVWAKYGQGGEGGAESKLMLIPRPLTENCRHHQVQAMLQRPQLYLRVHDDVKEPQCVSISSDNEPTISPVSVCITDKFLAVASSSAAGTRSDQLKPLLKFVRFADGPRDPATRIEFAPALAWETPASLLTRDRLVGAALVFYEGRFVVLGGASAPERKVSARVRAYDPATDTLTEMPPLPYPCAFASAIVVGHDLVVVGGAAPGLAQAHARVQVFLGESGQWCSRERKIQIGVASPYLVKKLDADSQKRSLFVIGGSAEMNHVQEQIVQIYNLDSNISTVETNTRLSSLPQLTSL